MLTLWPLLHGGDAARGRELFENHPAAQCVRCHSVDGAGGKVGRDLGMIGAHDRTYLLESVVQPNARVAPGFGTVTLTLRDSSSVTGMVREEDVRPSCCGPTTPRAACRATPWLARSDAASVMPPMLGVLAPGEVRDVIAFLATRREAMPNVALGAPLEASAVPAGDRSADGLPLRLEGRTSRAASACVRRIG